MVYTGFLRLKIELYYQILDFLSHIILLFLYFKDMIGMIGQSQYTESKMDQPLTFQGPTKEYRIKNIIILIDFLVILVSLAVSALISLPPSLINQIINLKVLFSLVSYYNKIIWFIRG